ncbi:hypothetical protein GCM10010099_22620 [Streptomyces cinereus]|nr:hypothetical protein GCM10010099_22620 [Streptomyces cinereus]
MTTAAKPLPAHGTTARGYGSPGRRAGCNCPPCRTARNRHQKQLRVNKALGRSPFTSPAIAQAHIQELHHTMSWDTLAAATGVQYSNLVAIYHGQRKKIRRDTEAKILAVKAPTKGDRGQYIDVTSTMRRVRALACVGHSYATISAAAGTSPNRIMSIANGRQPTIRRDLAERIAAVYQQLAFAPPAANKHTSRTRNVALAKGWHGPLAWDDIGDPDCQPETDYRPSRAQASTRRKVYADPARVARLTAAGKSAAEIAQVIGCHQRTVVRARGRADRMAVAA